MCAQDFAVQIRSFTKKPTHVESLLRRLETDGNENTRGISSTYKAQNREDARNDEQGYAN